MGRVAWNDHKYEGKLIRRIIDMLAKELKDADLDEKIKILNAIHQAANTKLAIDKHEDMDYKIRLVLKFIKEDQPKKFMENNYARELPGPNN